MTPSLPTVGAADEAWLAFNSACTRAFETSKNPPLFAKWYEETKSRFAEFTQVIERLADKNSVIAVKRAGAEADMARLEVLFAMNDMNGPLFTRWIECLREREKQFNALIQNA